MKNQVGNGVQSILAIAVFVGGLGLIPAVQGEVVISDRVKVEGFLDMSGTYQDKADGTETKTMSFDQWEVDVYLSPVDQVSARIDINDVTASGEGVAVEQAMVTYDFQNGLTATAGKWLTPLGWEGAEPTLLYQYSASATTAGIYPGYASGVGARYGTDLFSIYGSVVDGSYSGDGDAENVSAEGQLKLMPVTGLVIQAGYASEKFEAVLADADGAGGVEEYTKGFGNIWVEYKTGGLTMVGEFNVLEDIQGPGSDGEGYLAMANYDWGVPALTLRHSYVDLDNGYEDSEFTISPSFQVADPLLLVTEYRHDDYGPGGETDTFAAELIYTF